MTETVLQPHNQNGNVCRMNLTDYAISKGGTGKLGCPVLACTALAAQCSAATLYMIARGHKTVSARLAVRIAGATANEVEPRDLRPDVFGAADAVAEAARADTVALAPITKRALRSRLCLSGDGHLAKVLKLPAAEVEAWPEDDRVPALPQVLQLLGVQEQPPRAASAAEDPDADRIDLGVHAA